MTVAAIVLVPDLDVALSDADGEPAIRRLCQAAWAGGAMPIVLVVAGESSPLAAALADLPVAVANAAAEGAPGVAWFVFGLHSAVTAVAETSAGIDVAVSVRLGRSGDRHFPRRGSRRRPR